MANNAENKPVVPIEGIARLFQGGEFRFGETGSKEDEALLKKVEIGENQPIEVKKKETNQDSV
jgi:hypothetical protein